MLIATGQLTSFESTIETPLTVARDFEDRLPSLHNYVRYLCINCRFEEATDKCFAILNEFGEDFPSEVTPEIIQTEIASTAAMLTNFPKNDLRNLQPLSDPMKHSLLRQMVATMMVLFHYKSNYIPLLGCRIAQRSAQYGWCSYSSFGLYSFGQSLMCVPQMADAGYAW